MTTVLWETLSWKSPACNNPSQRLGITSAIDAMPNGLPGGPRQGARVAAHSADRAVALSRRGLIGAMRTIRPKPALFHPALHYFGNRRGRGTADDFTMRSRPSFWILVNSACEIRHSSSRPRPA